jgi:large subunit ribosomal protein L30
MAPMALGGVVPPGVTERAGQMAQLKVTQIRSKIGGTSEQRDSLRSLGLRRIGQVVFMPDRPEFRGMIKTVRHLVTVEEVTGDE